MHTINNDTTKQMSQVNMIVYMRLNGQLFRHHLLPKYMYAILLPRCFPKFGNVLGKIEE